MDGFAEHATTWRVEAAKERFSEVVRRARAAGPQHVTVRGRDAVVVIAAEDFARLTATAVAPTLADLFAGGPFARFDDAMVRERAPVRDAAGF